MLKKPGRKDFIPLIVKSSGLDMPKRPACSDIRTAKESFVELVYPNGTILRLNQDLDLGQLRALIHLYD